MFEYIFNFISWCNSHALSGEMAICGISMALTIIPFLLLKTSSQTNVKVVLVVGLIAVHAAGYLGLWLTDQALQSMTNYKVGSCFQMKSKYQTTDAIIDRALILNAKIKKISDAIPVAQKAGLASAESLKKRLVSMEQEISELEEWRQLPEVLDYVILENKTSVVAYRVADQKIEEDFSLKDKKYQVPCKAQVLQVVSNN